MGSSHSILASPEAEYVPTDAQLHLTCAVRTHFTTVHEVFM